MYNIARSRCRYLGIDEQVTSSRYSDPFIVRGKIFTLGAKVCGSKTGLIMGYYRVSTQSQGALALELYSLKVLAKPSKDVSE